MDGGWKTLALQIIASISPVIVIPVMTEMKSSAIFSDISAVFLLVHTVVLAVTSCMSYFLVHDEVNIDCLKLKNTCFLLIVFFVLYGFGACCTICLAKECRKTPKLRRTGAGVQILISVFPLGLLLYLILEKETVALCTTTQWLPIVHLVAFLLCGSLIVSELVLLLCNLMCEPFTGKKDWKTIEYPQEATCEEFSYDFDEAKMRLY